MAARLVRHFCFLPRSGFLASPLFSSRTQKCTSILVFLTFSFTKSGILECLIVTERWISALNVGVKKTEGEVSFPALPTHYQLRNLLGGFVFDINNRKEEATLTSDSQRSVRLGCFGTGPGHKQVYRFEDYEQDGANF